MIKLSDEDIHAMGWHAHHDDTAALQAVAHRLLDGRASLVALTLGAEGAVLVNRGGLVRRPIPSGVKVVDTVGAGDCFQAGLLVWLKKSGKLQPNQLASLSTHELDEALQHAMASAAINVQRQGCQPPNWLEARAWVEQGRVKAA